MFPLQKNNSNNIQSLTYRIRIKRKEWRLSYVNFLAEEVPHTSKANIQALWSYQHSSTYYLSIKSNSFSFSLSLYIYIYIFLKLGDLSFDEKKLQKRFLELFKSKLISKEIYEFIRPVGSQRPRMYGLPKIHKSGIPLRPTLSMCHSTQHSLAKWLVDVLNPVLEFYSVCCVKDIFLHYSSTARLYGVPILGLFWCCLSFH